MPLRLKIRLRFGGGNTWKSPNKTRGAVVAPLVLFGVVRDPEFAPWPSHPQAGEIISAYFPVSNPTISGAKSCAICWTSGMVRGASGLGKTTMRAPGIPRAVARACAALMKVLVMTLTEGTPLDSVITASWRPHAVQDPQSAIACITTSQSRERLWIVSSAQGAL